MSGRRIWCALLACVLGLTLPAAAQVIHARVGGDLAGRINDYVDVPVTIDMTGAPGRLLGGYRVRVTWDPAVLSYGGVESGNFADVQPYANANLDSASYGIFKATALVPAGMGGVLTLFALQFYVQQDTVVSPVTLTIDELTEAGTFANLLPLTQVTSGSFCRSLGSWGDTNGDGRSDSRDALIALSRVVGLIDTLRVDTLSITPLVTDTTRAALADVDGDGAVTSRDALIILSHAVGLNVTGFRIGLTAAGVCATGAATTLVILPDTIELQVEQLARVIAQARDATGRPVPIGSLVWRSSDASIASLEGPGYSDSRASSRAEPVSGMMQLVGTEIIEARAPGTATLTAEMGPGLRATVVVNVITRRRNWFVDVRALGTLTQTGTTRYPFGSIEDAVEESIDGDTVRIAAGTYAEYFHESESVALLGDPANRPVIDPRGNPSWSSGQTSMELGNPGDKVTLAHLVIRHAGIYLQGHDHEIRKVRFENIRSGEALEIYSQPNITSPTQPLTGGPGDNGNILIDSVDMVGMEADDGIRIDQADTVIVRNSTFSGDNALATCAEFAIRIEDASLGDIRDNQMSGLRCGAISYQSATGRVLISRNRINGGSWRGIEAEAPVVRLDHNVVRNLGANGLYPGYAIAVDITGDWDGVDTLISLGDSVINSGHRGMVIDSARIVRIDSLVISGVGQDSSSGAHGFEGGFGSHVIMRFSRITNVGNGDGIHMCDHSTLRTNRVVIRNVGWSGLTGQDCTDESGMDSLMMQNDSVTNIGFNAVVVYGARFARIDSLRADTAGSSGVQLSSVRRGEIVRSVIRRAFHGLSLNSVDTMLVSLDTIELNTDIGLLVYSTQDSLRVRQSVINANASFGMSLSFAPVRIDTSAVTNNGADGVAVEFSSGVRMRATRLQGNGQVAGTAIRLGTGAFSSVVRQSRIAGNNLFQGAKNDEPLAVLDADSVFWGGAFGPRCAVVVTGCDPLASGTTADSVLTTGITFASPLGAAPPTPAPPALLAAPARSQAKPAPVRPQQVQTREAPPVRPRRTTPKTRTAGN